MAEYERKVDRGRIYIPRHMRKEPLIIAMRFVNPDGLRLDVVSNIRTSDDYGRLNIQDQLQFMGIPFGKGRTVVLVDYKI